MRRAGWLLVAVLLVGATAQRAAADPEAQGRAAYRRGDHASAERLFAEAARRRPGDAVPRYHRAVALTELGRWAEAAQEYEAALRLNPSPDVAAASRQGLDGVQSLLRASSPRRGAAEETVVGLERRGGGWIAVVVLNGRTRARFLVDTGASITTISPGLAEDLDIRPIRGAARIRLQTANGPISAPPAIIPSLRVGDIEAHDAPAVIHDFGGGLDGILGNTFLARYTITLDADRGVLLLRGR
jgi:clan AA aspartic protease (TIGR02281 family)